jgi:ADP-heptose:LPS heptosyltransferase
VIGSRRHVLAIRADSMGDVLLTGPAIRSLAAVARVTVLAGPRGAAAARALPGVDAVLVHALPWIVADPAACDSSAIDPLLADVRRVAPDEAVIFTSHHQSALPLALLLRLAGVARIAAISDDYPGALLDVRHRVADDLHEVERAQSLATAAGFPPPRGDDQRLALRPGFVAPAPRRAPYVVVHPGASVAARAWDPDRARALVRVLTRGGTRVVVTGGEQETALTAHVAGGAPAAVDAGGAGSLAELAGVLAGADAVVCGNTGPAHLAAAVGTPVVSLYAPTVPAVRWRPWMVDHVLLGDQDIDCRGCRARVCPVAGHPCLDVSVADVLDALEAVAPASRTVSAA